MKLVYHYSYSFADDISLEIVRRVAGLPTIEGINGWQGENKTPAKKPNRVIKALRRVSGEISKKVLGSREPVQEPRLIGLGSIFTQARRRDVIWGTGVNPRWQPRTKHSYQLDIRAVRGPLSRKFIREELGMQCPEVYGDPALLMPWLFPELKRSKNPEHEYTVMLQHNDEPYIHANAKLFEKHHVILGQRVQQRPWLEMVNLILNSKYIISSSLHGLIIAETFGIPARWWHSPELPSTYTEHTLKFNDYYMSTGRRPNQFSETIEDALAQGPCAPISGFDHKALANAFPYEFFPGSKPPAFAKK